MLGENGGSQTKRSFLTAPDTVCTSAVTARNTSHPSRRNDLPSQWQGFTNGGLSAPLVKDKSLRTQRLCGEYFLFHVAAALCETSFQSTRSNNQSTLTGPILSADSPIDVEKTKT